ncbi:MAG: hypothetical protein ACLGGX_11495 [Bdellovibrionia bacterium]
MEKSLSIKKQFKALLVGAVLFSFVAPTLAEEGEPMTVCRNGSIVRTIRIEKIAGGCKTIYTKEGVDSQAGIAQTLQSCLDFATNISNNLSTAGWKCKTFNHAQVSVLGGGDNNNGQTVSQ